MKLYKLTNEYQQLLNMLDEDSEFSAEAITDTLEAITAEIEDKADNIACLLKSIDADVAAIKTEEARLAERRKAKQSAYDRIKSYLSEELQRANINKIETARNKITFRKSASVKIDDESAFVEWAAKYRDDLLTYAQPKANLTAIKKAINDGENITGAQIEEKQNIQIK